MKRFWLYIILSSAAVVAGINTYHAPVTAGTEVSCTAPVNISNLNMAFSYKYNTFISGNEVVWTASKELAPDSLYHHNLTTGITEPVSDGIAEVFYPYFWLHGSHLVWSQPDETGDPEIYYRNLENMDVIQITDNVANDYEPYTDGQRIAWFGPQVSYYNLNDNSTHTINQTADQYNFRPYIVADTLLWGRARNLFKYDIPSDTTTQITNHPEDSDPFYIISDVDESDVLWAGYDGDDLDIFMYNLNTDTLSQITANSGYDDYDPSRDGNIITWTGDYLSQYAVYMHDLSTHQTYQISERGNNARVSAGQVAWEEYDGNDYEIMLYDAASGITVPVTENEVDDTGVSIDQHHLVWSGYDNGYSEIFYSECNPVEQTPTPTATIETTPTATGVPPVELIQNGGFEAQTGAVPDLSPWTLKFKSRDKIVCNQPDTPAAHTGECAFRFRGSLQENSTLDQIIDLTGINFTSGDLLHLSVYLNAPNPAASGKIKVRVKYGDGTSKGKITRTIPVVAGYTRLQGQVEIASSEVARVHIRVHNASSTGKIYLDDVSLTHTGVSNLIQLPE